MYSSLQSFADFKEDMHNVYIKARKDSAQTWTKLPFIAIDDDIFFMLDSWPAEWHASDLAKRDRTVAQTQKDETKLRVTKLAQQRCNEKAAAEVSATREAAKAAAK